MAQISQISQCGTEGTEFCSLLLDSGCIFEKNQNPENIENV